MPDNAEFLASIAEAAKAAGEEVDATDQVSSVSNAASGDRSGAGRPDLVETGESGEDDPDSIDGAEDSEESSTPGELDAASVADLLTNGNLDELCKRAGVDPKILKVNAGKLRHDRELIRKAQVSETNATKALEAAQAEKRQAEQILDGGRKQYGWAVDLKNMIAAGDFLGIKEVCIGLAPKGMTWEQINAGIVKAERGDNPSEVLYRREIRRIAEEREAEKRATETAKAAEAAKTADAEQARKNLESASARLKGTDFEKVPGAAEKLVAIVDAAYDKARGGFTITPKEALQRLEADPLIALALKAVRSAKGGERRPANEAPLQRRNGRGQFVRPAKSAEDRAASGKTAKGPTHDEELAASIAEATRLEQANQRSAGGRRR